jgi:hypothetical protein
MNTTVVGRGGAQRKAVTDSRKKQNLLFGRERQPGLCDITAWPHTCLQLKFTFAVSVPLEYTFVRSVA